MLFQAVDWTSWEHQRLTSLFLQSLFAWLYFESPIKLIATLPVYLRAYFNFCGADWLSLNSNFLFISFSEINHKFTFLLINCNWVPTFKTPCSTSTPRTIGSFFLKVATCFNTQGKTASLPSFLFSFLSYFFNIFCEHIH